MKKVVLIGAGNVNWHLGHALPKRKYEVIQVYSRTKKSARDLAFSLHCKSTTRLDKIDKAAHILIIAVTDDALLDVADQLQYLKSEDRLFIHTSGSTSLLALEKYFTKCGVFWPPQSIRKENKINIKKTPFVVVANDDSLKAMKTFASSLTKHVHFLSESQKSHLHLAAVFANNFTTHLLALAYQECKTHEIDFQLLHPIIKETFERITDQNPAHQQTGPAIRGDHKTINRHVKLLKGNKELKRIYTLISENINPKLKK
jgi:predicted short-subunit dehydrogenase-like oxidoreductase (DUF2520 family)